MLKKKEWSICPFDFHAEIPLFQSGIKRRLAENKELLLNN
jgi:hypothetical protein